MTPEAIAEAIAPLDLPGRLEWIGRNLSPAAFSTSFGMEDQVVTHAIAESGAPVRVFTLDTGRLFEETQAVFATTRERYGVHIETFFPDPRALQDYVSANGPNGFYDSVELRVECCRIRKVEPLGRALKGAGAWITGLRRGQSSNRSDLPFAEWDEQHGLVKVHPLLDWSDARLEAHVRERNISVNRLHAKGFPSIGCAPCTRAVPPGQDPRSGRWWWEDKTKRECGLHLHRDEKA